MRKKLLGIIRAILIGLVIVSGAIALPILFRPFFYWHITPLGLTDMVELTTEQVKSAYNEIINFCIGLTDTFSVGALPFSESGAEHFADVRKLFVLDLRVLVAAGIMLIIMTVVFRKERLRLLGHTPGFWGAVGLGVTFSVVGGLAALDFDRAFVIFHMIFFPGKDNWLFDGRTDPIIHILPVAFFRNCAILIFIIICLCCAGLLLWDRKVRHRGSKNTPV